MIDLRSFEAEFYDFIGGLIHDKAAGSKIKAGEKKRPRPGARV